MVGVGEENGGDGGMGRGWEEGGGVGGVRGRGGKRGRGEMKEGEVR